jgi:flagellar motility protein MotE (MotC chaperone)
MITLLQNPWLASALGGLSFLLTFALIPLPPPPAPADPSATLASPSAPGPSWKFINPEINMLIDELKTEKETLTTRAAQLNELAERLRTERDELNQVTQTIHRMQRELDDRVARIKENETATLKKLAKTYAAMSPEGAAGIFRQMDDAAVVQVMAFMKESENGPILEALAKLGDTEAKRAAALTDRLRLLFNKKS